MDAPGLAGCNWPTMASPEARLRLIHWILLANVQGQAACRRSKSSSAILVAGKLWIVGAASSWAGVDKRLSKGTVNSRAMHDSANTHR